MPLVTATTCAGYRIVRRLGSGGMGEVYLAEHPRLPRRDALKILPADVSADPAFRERFNREADLAATLWHPHIVGLHDRGEHQGQLWISMDYVDGADAAQLLLRSYPGGMPADEVLEIVAAIADALDYAHDSGLLHRDVKPSNILITQPASGKRRILLTDFGIARRLDDISGLTVTNMTVGTMSYAAPEQLMDGQVDGRADQYALAASAFHLLTGSPLFKHSNPAVVISKHLNGAPPKVSDVKPGLARLDAAMACALAKNPADRFPRCRDFAEALKAGRGNKRRHRSARAAIAGRPKTAGIAAAPPSSTPVPARSTPVASTRSGPQTSQRQGRSRTALAVLSIVGLLLAGSVIVAGLRASDARRQASAADIVDEAGDDSGPSIGSPCASNDVNTTTTSASNTPLRCMSVRHGHVWQSNDEVERIYPLIAGEFGWRNCLGEFSQDKCEAAAALWAGAPGSTGPFIPPGTYTIPAEMSEGLYAAAKDVAASGCSWRTYDEAGLVLDAGSEKQEVDIGPQVARFTTAGCTPWVRESGPTDSGS